MRKSLPIAAVVVALALGAPAPAFATTPVVADVDQSFACEAGVVYKTLTIVSSDVTIDGCTFDGAGATAAAIRNGVAGVSNITITNSTFQGYTGRTIAFGFAEGVSLAGDRASNVTISNNTVGNMAGNAATSIAIFNTDGVSITDNTISNSDPLFTGRRGINLDSNTAVRVQNNSISLGATVAGTSFGMAPWAVQVSMSDAAAVDHDIVNNTISGSAVGISVLSQKDVTDLKIVNNDIATVFGVRLNAGASTAPQITLSDIQVSANRHDVTGFDQTGYSLSQGVRLENSSPSTYQDVRVTGNRTLGGTNAVVVVSTPTLENVIIRGNR